MIDSAPRATATPGGEILEDYSECVAAPPHRAAQVQRQCSRLTQQVHATRGCRYVAVDWFEALAKEAKAPRGLRTETLSPDPRRCWLSHHYGNRLKGPFRVQNQAQRCEWGAQAFSCIQCGDDILD
jgi:hypothetical protein